MIVRRRTWLYRLAGQTYAQIISFTQPLAAAQAREAIRRAYGEPVDLWARSGNEVPLAVRK